MRLTGGEALARWLTLKQSFAVDVLTGLVHINESENETVSVQLRTDKQPDNTPAFLMFVCTSPSQNPFQLHSRATADLQSTPQ